MINVKPGRQTTTDDCNVASTDAKHLVPTRFDDSSMYAWEVPPQMSKGRLCEL